MLQCMPVDVNRVDPPPTWTDSTRSSIAIVPRSSMSTSAIEPGSAPAPSNPSHAQASIDDKIVTDLEVVENKIRQCEGLMIGSDLEMLLATVGFLEACAPRMIELVEAAAQGALSEHVLVRCLDVNDKLQKLLDDVDRDPPGSRGAAATSASAASAGAPSASGGGAADLLFSEDVATTATSDAVIGKTKSEDEFDSFFNERHETS
jgi:hypothetical protein